MHDERTTMAMGAEVIFEERINGRRRITMRERHAQQPRWFVRDEQQIVGHLQVVSSCEIAAGEEADRLQLPRVAGIQDRQAVAEHVAHVQVSPVQHDLHAVGTAAEVAVRHVANAPADALPWNRRVGLTRRLIEERQRGESRE